jgi:hypothetical protein
MRTFPNLRERTQGGAVQFDPAGGTLRGPLPPKNPAQKNVVSSFLGQIATGLFGAPATPQNQLSSQVAGTGPKSLYHFHEGDLFTPGAQNYAFDAFQELPMNTIWGHGFLRKPNTFEPIPETPVSFIPPGTSYVKLNGVGGLVAGQLAFQPLENNGD